MNRALKIGKNQGGERNAVEAEQTSAEPVFRPFQPRSHRGQSSKLHFCKSVFVEVVVQREITSPPARRS